MSRKKSLILKPCPFCGGKAEIKKQPPSLPEVPEDFWVIQCRRSTHCTAWPVVAGETREGTIAAWNTRKEAA